MDAQQQQIGLAGAALLCAGLGSIDDIRQRRIPNYVTFPAIAAALAAHTAASGWRGLEDAVLAGLIAGSIFLIFYLAGGMGAGDVKLMTAVGCLIGLSSLHLVVIATAIAGAVLAVIVSIRHGQLRKALRNVGVLLDHHRRRGLQPHPNLNLSSADAVRLPFALPIAVGCLFTVCMLAWEAHS